MQGFFGNVDTYNDPEGYPVANEEHQRKYFVCRISERLPIGKWLVGTSPEKFPRQGSITSLD